MSDFRLERQDLFTVDPISEFNTLAILPMGKKGTQKLIVGDDSGTIHCYEFKKREPLLVFRTEYFKTPVSCVTLASGPKTENIFISSRQQISAITKKGNKPYYNLSTTLIENLKAIRVDEQTSTVYALYDTIFNSYKNDKQDAYFLNGDVINCMITANIAGQNDTNVFLGCKDSRVRILLGERVVLEIPTKSSVTSLSIYDYDQHVLKRGPCYLAIGQESGIISMVKIEKKSEDSKTSAGGAAGGEFPFSYQDLWEIQAESEVRSSINCLKVFDLNKDGKMEIIVGRDNGTIAVYSFEKDGFNKAQINDRPRLVYSSDIGEKIQAIDCGSINSAEFKEIIVAGFSGRIYSFTMEPILRRAANDQYGRSVQTLQNENRIKALKAEVEELTKKVEKEREEATKNASSRGNTLELLPPEELSVSYKCLLNPVLAAYELSLELQTSIDIVVLRSCVVLDFVDSDIGTSVLSNSPVIVGSSGAADIYVYSFRCQSKEKRIALKFRTAEGKFGNLKLSVVADDIPKRAKVLTIPILPLSLHTKVYSLPKADLQRPKNSITFTNTVSNQITFQDWHLFIEEIFPETPSIASINTDMAPQEDYIFKNVFTGAITTVSYKRNECTISSESISTLRIVNESFTRISLDRRKQIDQALSVEDDTIDLVLSLLKDKLLDQLSMARRVSLLDSIEEVTIGSTDNSPWLKAELAEILSNKDFIRQSYKSHAKSLNYLVSIVEDLFVDWNKYKGVDVSDFKSKVTGIINEKNFDFNDLVRVILTGGGV